MFRSNKPNYLSKSLTINKNRLNGDSGSRRLLATCCQATLPDSLAVPGVSRGRLTPRMQNQLRDARASDHSFG